MYHTTVVILLILLHKLTSHCTSFSSQDVIISFFCGSFTIMSFVDIGTFFYFCMGVWHECVCMCTRYVPGIHRSPKRAPMPWNWSYLWLGSTMCQELNLGPQQEPVLLTTQPSHQSLCWYFCTEITFLDITIKIPFMYLRRRINLSPIFEWYL